MFARVITTHIYENVPAIIGRAHTEAVDAMTHHQFGKSHTQHGSKPTGHVVAAGGHMHVRSGAVDPDIRDGLRLLKDAIDPLGSFRGAFGFEHLADPLPELAHRDEIGLDRSW